MPNVVELSENLSLRDGFLYCEEVCIKTLQEDLLTKLGESSCSPFFVYSRSQLLKNVTDYQLAFSTNQPPIPAQIGYALKANYNVHLVSLVQELGCCAIAVSGNEVRLALAAGFAPDRIILNGNGKQKWEIELAIKIGCLINIDSLFDFHHIKSMTETVGQKIKCLIRLNPDIDPDVHPFLATGLSKSKFGVDDAKLEELLKGIIDEERLELVGLHCHLGSTISNTQVFKECLDVMLKFADRARSAGGIATLKYINLGGGLNIDYRRHENRTSATTGDPASAKSALAGVANPISRSPPLPADLARCIDAKKLAKMGLTLIIEPGRSIVGSTGVLVTKVIGCKSAGAKNYIVVDGAMTEVIRPSLYGAYHHIELTEPVTTVVEEKTENAAHLTGCSSGGSRLCDVVGPVCECADFLGKDRLLAIPHEGCGLAIFDVGAYCSSMSSNYNMRTNPAEILVDGNSWSIIRRPGTFEDLMMSFT